MSGRLVLVFVMLFAVPASAKPKPWPTKILHNSTPWGFSPSWYATTTPEKDTTSKSPCTGPDRHAIIEALDDFIYKKLPDIKITNDEMFLHIGGTVGWQAADSYSVDEDGDRITDPLTAHWVIDKDTEIHISILREPDQLPYGGVGEATKYEAAHRMAVSIVKYRGTSKYCYERYTSEAVVKEVLK